MVTWVFQKPILPVKYSFFSRFAFVFLLNSKRILNAEFGKRLENWMFGFVLGWNNIIINLSQEVILVIFLPHFKFPRHRRLKTVVSALHNPHWSCRAGYPSKATITLTSQIIWIASLEQSSPLARNTSDLCIKDQPDAEVNSLLECLSCFPGPRTASALPRGSSWVHPGPWNLVLALQPGLCSRKDFPESNFPFKISKCCNRTVYKSTIGTEYRTVVFMVLSRCWGVGFSGIIYPHVFIVWLLLLQTLICTRFRQTVNTSFLNTFQILGKI